MKWVTHIAFAFFIVKLTEIIFLTNFLDSYVAYIIVSLFAVLPDLDFILGLKHRTYTHTLYFTAIALILTPISLKLTFIAWISIFSHLIGDMMMVSGVKLFYPCLETVYYLVPPSWRIRVGSNSEFFVLGVLIIVAMLLTSLTPQTEVAKLFELSRDHNIEASFSIFENGALYKLDHVEIVWTDGDDEIGYIEEGKLQKIPKDRITNVYIWKVEEVDRILIKSKVRIKDLRKNAWRHRIVVKYSLEDLDYGFTGTGYDLYLKLRKELDKYTRLTVWYYEVR